MKKIITFNKLRQLVREAYTPTEEDEKAFSEFSSHIGSICDYGTELNKLNLDPIVDKLPRDVLLGLTFDAQHQKTPKIGVFGVVTPDEVEWWVDDSKAIHFGTSRCSLGLFTSDTYDDCEGEVALFLDLDEWNDRDDITNNMVWLGGYQFSKEDYLNDGGLNGKKFGQYPYREIFEYARLMDQQIKGFIDKLNKLAGSNITFKITKDKLNSYSGNDASITIPNEVKVIGVGAFEGNDTLGSVTIPATVKKVSANAFANCSGLTSITLGTGIKKIEKDAFRGVSEHITVYVPNFSICELLIDSGLPDSAIIIVGEGSKRHRVSLDTEGLNEGTSIDDDFDYDAIVKKMRILKEEYGERYIARLLSDTFGYEEVLQALDDAINED